MNRCESRLWGKRRVWWDIYDEVRSGRDPPGPSGVLGTSSFVINKRLERVKRVQREAFRANEPWGIWRIIPRPCGCSEGAARRTTSGPGDHRPDKINGLILCFRRFCTPAGGITNHQLLAPYIFSKGFFKEDLKFTLKNHDDDGPQGYTTYITTLANL